MRRQDGVCSEFIRLMACLNSLCGWVGVFDKSVALLLVHIVSQRRVTLVFLYSDL